MYRISQIAGEYEKRKITAAEAAARVQDGDRISYGLGLSAPVDIDRALGARIQSLRGVEIVGSVLIKSEPYAVYTESTSNTQVRFASAHMNSMDRKMNKDGRCWFIPMLFNDCRNTGTGLIN